jgi:hypothetical protein
VHRVARESDFRDPADLACLAAVRRSHAVLSLTWDHFKVPALPAEFKPPKGLVDRLPPLQEADFMPDPPTGIGARTPDRGRAYAQAVAQDPAVRTAAVALACYQTLGAQSAHWWPGGHSHCCTLDQGTGAPGEAPPWPWLGRYT